MFTLTPSQLAVSQIDDVSDWKARNILEQSAEGSSPALPPLAGSQMKRKISLKKKQRLFWKLNKEASSRMVGGLWGASRISVFPRGPRLKSEDGDQDDSCPHLQPLVQALPTFYFREEDSMMNAAGELILLLFLLRSSSPLTSFGVVAPPPPPSLHLDSCATFSEQL